MRSDRVLIGLLTAAGLAAVATACLLGSTPLGAGRVLSALVGAASPGDLIVVWEIRLPRVLAAFGTGAALQGLLRNPLAEPGVLGGVRHRGAGALGATALLTVAAARVGSVVTLILVGVGLSSFAGAMMALLMNLAPNPFSLADMLNWTLGTVANRSFADLPLAAPFLLAGLGLLLAARRGLSALTLGEEAASGVGVDLPRARRLVVVGAGLATGAAVSTAGEIGFVGFVAPHLVRPLVDHDPARTLVPSALLGGAILVLADIGVRLAPTDTELRLGVVATLIGAPVFIWIAARRRVNGG